MTKWKSNIISEIHNILIGSYHLGDDICNLIEREIKQFADDVKTCYSKESKITMSAIDIMEQLLKDRGIE